MLPSCPSGLSLKKGEKDLCPSTGRSTEDAFPYYNFEYGNKGAFVVTSWSGQWQADFEYNNGVTAFSGRQQTFSSYSNPARPQELLSPQWFSMTDATPTAPLTFGEIGSSTATCIRTTEKIPPNPLLRALLRRSITKWKMPPRQIRLPVSKNISKQRSNQCLVDGRRMVHRR